jgi:NADH pyrophosphatase NudC (nudix superfamily)
VAPEADRVSPALAELHDIRWFRWDETDALGPDSGLRRALAKAKALVRR